MSTGIPITYRQLLDRHDRIEIPLIQRDYAQGRPVESEVRNAFLSTLEDALRKSADGPSLPLNLDFIYGSIEGEGQTCFTPLDGQQRLTTLFLLHWYLAWRDDQWDSFAEMFLHNGKARFTYSVRPSSNEFFDALVAYRPAVNPVDVTCLSALLRDQPWYFRSWRLDPTVQSVSHMLDAIHLRFAGSTGLFLKLTDSTRPAITFYLLDLEHFGLSDDLYIKMNARGKPLTAFETFKARYEEVLKGQFDSVTFELAGESLSVADYVARKLDTVWSDLFWQLRDRKSNLYDDALMNVLRLVALITRKPEESGYLDDIGFLRRSWSQPSYSDFHSRGWLDKHFSLTLIYLFDTWSAINGTLTPLLPSTRYFDEGAIFANATQRGANLSYVDLIQFAAYASYFEQNQGKVDSAELQEWMRIIRNLSVNTEYNRPDDFRRSIQGLFEFLAHADDVLDYVARAERVVRGFNEVQLAEEKLKAELILADDGWRALVDRAEKHGYFRGQIGFLLSFSGVEDQRKDSPPSDWDVRTHKEFQDTLLRYLSLAERMFSARGLDDPGRYRWQRALLVLGDYLLPSGRNRSCLRNSTTGEGSWKRLLRGTGPASRPRQLLKQLWDQLNPDDVVGQLDDIINTADDIDDWRMALVQCPEALAYCENQSIRRDVVGPIYLLRRSQLNGAHAELFSYCLFQQLTANAASFKKLSFSYKSVNDTYTEPHICMSSSFSRSSMHFRVYYGGRRYRIETDIANCMEVEELSTQLISCGYVEDEENFRRLIEDEEMLDQISDLDAILNKVDNGVDDEKSGPA